MYVNCGDVNFFEGGRLVEDQGNGVFSIISCDFIFDAGDDAYLFADVEVDVNDDWIDKAAVESFSGGSENDMMFALDALSYYGPQEFGDPGEQLTKAEIIDRLDSWYGEFEEQPWHYED
jgi:hypothetical protein